MIKIELTEEQADIIRHALTGLPAKKDTGLAAYYRDKSERFSSKAKEFIASDIERAKTLLEISAYCKEQNNKCFDIEKIVAVAIRKAKFGY